MQNVYGNTKIMCLLSILVVYRFRSNCWTYLDLKSRMKYPLKCLDMRRAKFSLFMLHEINMIDTWICSWYQAIKSLIYVGSRTCTDYYTSRQLTKSGIITVHIGFVDLQKSGCLTITSNTVKPRGHKRSSYPKRKTSVSTIYIYMSQLL